MALCNYGNREYGVFPREEYIPAKIDSTFASDTAWGPFLDSDRLMAMGGTRA